MTDTEDLELFDDAKTEFPAKEDLKDRLVAIWVTGKTGERKSPATGKTYGWVETITLVLDDGPNGASITDLVPNAPQTLDNFQWSAAGLYSRLSQRVQGGKPKTFKPMVGRINSRKNAVKGMADAWSIAEPTDEDRAVARAHADLIRSISAKLQETQRSADDEAFD